MNIKVEIIEGNTRIETEDKIIMNGTEILKSKRKMPDWLQKQIDEVLEKEDFKSEYPL